MQETGFQSLGQEDPLEKGMATHSSTLAWRSPWTEEPGGLQSKAKVKSLSRVRLFGLLSTRLLCPWDFPGNNIGVGCHFLLQEIFLIQGLNPGLLHCRQTLYHLSHQGVQRGGKTSEIRVFKSCISTKTCFIMDLAKLFFSSLYQLCL